MNIIKINSNGDGSELNKVYEGEPSVSYSSSNVICCLGTFGNAKIEIGMVIGGEYFAVPDASVENGAFSYNIDYGVGVLPAIRVIDADSITDIKFIAVVG